MDCGDPLLALETVPMVAPSMAVFVASMPAQYCASMVAPDLAFYGQYNVYFCDLSRICDVFGNGISMLVLEHNETKSAK